MKILYKSVLVFSVSLMISFTSCKHNPNDPGTEYAPQMYHSHAYEPLTQIVDKDYEYYNSLPYNDYNGAYNMNMKEPVKGTVKFNGYNPKIGANKVSNLMIYNNLTENDFELAGNTLVNPIPKSDIVLEEGKALYSRYCQHCHGETGQGDGLVGKVFKGVPAYNKGQVKLDKEGNIFHVITFGRNRMKSHASQVSVSDRWKIVHYVQQLQNQ